MKRNFFVLSEAFNADYSHTDEQSLNLVGDSPIE